VKRFQFRLAPLLRYREFREQQARQAVSNARRDVLACEADIARLQGHLGDARCACDREAAAGMMAERFLHFTHFLQGIETRIDAESKRRRTLLKELAVCQARLAETVVQRRSVENLKERRRTEYYQEMAKELQKETDDMTIIRQVRKEKV
jgi:flagellar FliJ protein